MTQLIPDVNIDSKAAACFACRSLYGSASGWIMKRPWVFSEKYIKMACDTIMFQPNDPIGEVCMTSIVGAGGDLTKWAVYRLIPAISPIEVCTKTLKIC